MGGGAANFWPDGGGAPPSAPIMGNPGSTGGCCGAVLVMGSSELGRVGDAGLQLSSCERSGLYYSGSG